MEDNVIVDGAYDTPEEMRYLSGLLSVPRRVKKLKVRKVEEWEDTRIVYIP